MALQKYSGYIAYIHKADDSPSSAKKGEQMKEEFPGADYELVEGDPCGQCSDVAGPDEKTGDAIKDWINAAG